MIIFNTSLNSFARKYLLKNIGEDERFLAQTFTSEYYKTLAEIVEQLILFDKISIKVYGENVGLAVLINEIGLKQVYELVDEGALEFLLWTPMLTTMTDDSLLGKMNPIQSGNMDSAVHCQPEESLRVGFQALKNQPDRITRRIMTRKLAPSYILPKENFVHNAANFVTDAYNNNSLAVVGLPKEKDISWLNSEERFKLLGLGDEILESTILSTLNYSSLGSYRNFEYAQQSFSQVVSASSLVSNMNELYQVEKIPDIKSLLLEKHIVLKDLIKLRRKNTSKKFRAWLASKSLADSDYITKEYINEITNHKGFFETTKGKFIKTIGMYSIGGVTGGIAAGATGTFAGITLGKILEPVADLGLNFIDTYFLDGLIKGWQPKLFINEYEKIINKTKSDVS